MPQAEYTRDRRGVHIGAEAAMSRSFDMPSRSLVVRTTAGAVRYLEDAVADGATGASPARVAQRSVTANDAAPNTTPPDNANVVPKRDQGEAIFFAALASGESCDIEVWAETDLYSDPADVTSARLWVLVGRILVVQPYVEYRAATGHRRVFLRVVNTSSGIDAENPFTLYATTA